MKKKIIYGIILLILLVGVGLGGYYLGSKKDRCAVEDTNEKVDNNQPTEKVSKDTLVISNARDLIYEVNGNYEVLWSYKVKESTSVFNILRVDGDYIYFTDNDKLFRRNSKTDEIEDLDIILKDYWNFHVSGNTVVYDVLFDVFQVSLNTKEQTKLSFQTNNEEALIDGILYYTSKENQSLNSYNLETKENIKIETEARIVEYDKDNILYVNSNNEHILYSVKDGKKQKLLKADYSYASGLRYPIHMYNGKVYTMEEDSLDIISSEKNSIYKHALKENETVVDFIFLNENKVLLSIFVEDVDSECQYDICEPEGDNKYYLINLTTKEEKEITKDIDIMDDSYEFYHMYE